MQRRYRTALILACLVLVPDLATKAAVASSLRLGQSVELIPGFLNLTYVLNRGASFGFLNTPDIGWQRGLFIGVTILALGVIGWLLNRSREDERLLAAGLGLIAGGALGNLVDRITTGLVVDFLDFHVSGWHWPAFNVADCGITLGAGAVLLTLLGSKNDASDSV